MKYEWKRKRSVKVELAFLTGSGWIVPLLELSNCAESGRESEMGAAVQLLRQRWDGPEMDPCIINEAEV